MCLGQEDELITLSGPWDFDSGRAGPRPWLTGLLVSQTRPECRHWESTPEKVTLARHSSMFTNWSDHLSFESSVCPEGVQAKFSSSAHRSSS